MARPEFRFPPNCRPAALAALVGLPRVVTHPGRAHLDEYVACSLLAALSPQAKIHRSRDAGLLLDAANDCRTAVVDIGGRFEPDRLNFDHHQIDFASDGDKCALSLVLEFLGIRDEAAAILPWLPVLDMRDCGGPSAVEARFGVSLAMQQAHRSPLEIFTLREFSQVGVLSPGAPIHAAMRRFGASLLDTLAHTPVAAAEVAAAIRYGKLESAGGDVLVADITDVRSEIRPFMNMVKPPDGLAIAASVHRDPRDGCWLVRILEPGAGRFDLRLCLARWPHMWFPETSRGRLAAIRLGGFPEVLEFVGTAAVPAVA